MSNKRYAKYSIFLPVRNGGTHLSLCVSSILAQSYPGFELIILENQSTDGTAEWLQALDKREPRVSVIAAESAMSMEENWQRILKIEKNEYMTIIGHDDLYDENFLEEIDKTIQEQPGASLYLTHFRLVDNEGKFMRYCNPIPRQESVAEFLAARMTRIRDSFGTGYVMRSALYEQVGGIPAYPNLLYADDTLWISLMRSAHTAVSPRSCFSYRYHSKSVSGNANQDALFAGLKKHLEFLRRLVDSDPDIARVMDHYGRPYISRACQNYYYFLIKSAPLGRPVDRRKLLEINSMMSEFCDQTIKDTRASKLQMVLWHWLVGMGRKFLPLIESALNKK